MKILTLYFKNINSLQGEHLIDFSQAPLVNVGVFAITGPNGSGKTSVLDAITLSLYGETFKFDRPAAHVMTQNTNECFAQVDFLVRDVQYRSLWHVEKDANNVMQITMQLARVADEVVLATDIIKVRAMIAEIIGLNFRNFTRSILLAQGDFAAFLNALDSERLDILEKIVNTDIYADYKHELQSQANETQAKLQNLQQDLDAIIVLDPVSKEAKEADLSDFQLQKQELQQALEATTEQIDHLHFLADLREQQRAHEQQQQALVNTLSQIEQQLKQIDQHQGISALQLDFDQLQHLETVVQDDQNSLGDYKQELVQLQSQVTSLDLDAAQLSHIGNRTFIEQQDIIGDLAFQTEQMLAQQRTEKMALNALELQLNEKRNIASDIQKWLVEHAQDATLLDGFPDIGKLKKLNVDIVYLKEQSSAYQKRFKAVSGNYQKNQNQIDTIQTLIPQLKKDLEQSNQKIEMMTEGHSLEELQALFSEQSERVSDFKDLIALSKIHDRFKDSFLVRLGIIRPPVDLDVAEILAQLATLNSEFTQEENIKTALEHAVFNETLINKLHAERAHLVEGEPCPLCGALKHPYTKGLPKATDSQQALVTQKARVQTLLTQITKVQQQLKLAEKQAQIKQQRKDRILRIQAEWLTLSNRLGVISQDLQLENVGLMKKLLKEQQQELSNIEQLIKNVRQHQQKISKLTTEISQQEEALTQLNLSKQELNDKLNIDPNELQKIETQLAQAIAEEQLLKVKVQEQLSLLSEKMPARGKDEALFKRLNTRRQNYQTYLLREKHITEEMTDLEQQLKLAQATVVNSEQQLQNFSSKYNAEQGVGMHLAIIEKQRLVAEKEAKITQLQQQVHTAQLQLQIQAQSYGLLSLSAFVDMLQLLPQRERFLQEQNALQQQIAQTSNVLTSLQTQLQTESVKLQQGKLLADYEVDYKNLLEKVAISDMEIEHLSQLLAQQDSLHERSIIIQDNIKQTRAEFLEARQALEEITAGSGHAFRRRAQLRLADRLLTKTNQLLEKINGRFYVRQSQSEQGLALEIEDTFQQNTRRLPKTLSGGESFVVSLALALGLSDLASDGQMIESLFLDEGFGNLDAEALYTVVSTLESLQLQGRTVGVISHVEGIRKRIKTQIELVKKPNGLSELKALA